MPKVDFNNATKENWRRWAWNRHKVVCPHGGTALIMAGTDVESEVKLGRDRGFTPVCCDIDEGNVAEARKKGEVAVWDDIHHQIACLRPTVVTLDFMGGLSQKARDCLLAATAVCDSVVINLLRGRDSMSDDLRKVLNTKIRGFPQDMNQKHRGLQAAKLISMFLAYRLNKFIESKGFPDSQRSAEKYVLKTLDPTYYSYRSRSSTAKLYYDSVHLRGSWNPEVRERVAGSESNWAKEQREAEMGEVRSRLDMAISKTALGSKRKAAAVKANLRRRRNLGM